MEENLPHSEEGEVKSQHSKDCNEKDKSKNNYEEKSQYFRERGIETYVCQPGETYFAVLRPRTDDEGLLREIGEHLQTWMMGYPKIKRILGIKQLLEGQYPKVPTEYLSIPMASSDPSEWLEEVALVVVEKGADMDELWESLYGLGKHNGHLRVVPYGQYRDENR